MARFVFLDAGPLGLACSRPGLPGVDRCNAWLVGLEFSGVRVVVPAITDYEVRRELLRIHASEKIKRLDALIPRFDRLAISGPAMLQAAEYWAVLRRSGIPTSGPDDLDADAILAGMAATYGVPGDFIEIATTNLRHLARFPGVAAREWSTIV